MKVLSAFLPQVRRVLTHGRWFTPSVVVAFVLLEMFGRKALTDVHDTVFAVVLLLIIAGIGFRHRVNPIPWVDRLGGLVARLARLGSRFKVDLGPDLRGSPHIPRRLPDAVYALAVFFAAWSAMAATIWYYSPQGWR